MSARCSLAAIALTLGCASDESTSTAPDAACQELELALPDGSCIRPGIEPEGCAAGFDHDGGYGCEPILPAEPCPRGLMAVPSERECRPVMPCSASKWGDIPIDATTMHVDAAYSGGASDGSASRPWITIGEAFAAAAPGALIAVAAGSYAEDVIVDFKPARIWGVCPERVSVVGSGAELATIIIGAGADGSEVHGIAIRGPTMGLYLVGSEGVTVDRVWVDGPGTRGINVQSLSRRSTITVVDSLVEQAHQFGIYVSGSEAIVSASTVRGTLPLSSEPSQCRGIHLQPSCPGGVCDPGAPAHVAITGSVVEQSQGHGIMVAGSRADVEATVVRDTYPLASDQTSGVGIAIEPCRAGFSCVVAVPGSATVRRSVVERSRDVGLWIWGSDATVESTVVRDTAPRASDQAFGVGIAVEPCLAVDGCSPPLRASATVERSLVERSYDQGLVVLGSDGTVEQTVVRDTLPEMLTQLKGHGIHIQVLCTDTGCDQAWRASATVRGSLVERSHDVGLFIGGSDGTVEQTVVRDTKALIDGTFGDGIAVDGFVPFDTATLTNVRIDNSARAGLSNFGALVSIGHTTIQCASFELEGEPWQGLGFVYEDRGENRCGCPTATDACQVITVGLVPPSADR